MSTPCPNGGKFGPGSCIISPCPNGGETIGGGAKGGNIGPFTKSLFPYI